MLIPLPATDFDPTESAGHSVTFATPHGVRAEADPVAAICHGVLLAARSPGASGRSVLFGRKTTALTKTLELSAWALTALWMGRYYRIYARMLQGEVTSPLASPDDFQTGPSAVKRDSPTNLSPGFVVKDGNYLSARWPGDAIMRDGSDMGRLTLAIQKTRNQALALMEYS